MPYTTSTTKNHLLGISIANSALLKEHSIEATLNTCLKALGESHNVDRCYILKIEKDTIQYCNEWCHAGIHSFLNNSNLKSEICDDFPEMYAKLANDEPLYGAVKECNNHSFTKIMSDRSVQTYLLTPIFSKSKLWGWVGYENCSQEKNWDDEQVYSLHLLAKNIGIRINQNKIFAKLCDNLDYFNFYIQRSKRSIWELDLKTNTVRFSPNWGKMIGYNTIEITHTYDFWKKNVHLEDIVRVEEELKNYILNTSDCYEGVYRMKHKNGHFIWIKYNGLLKKNSNGKPIKIIGTHIDVNELKEKERQLQLSEEKFKFIADNTSDVICQHSIDGKYSYVSNSIKEILGYEPIEMIDKKAFDFIHPDDYKVIFDAHAEFIKGQKTGTSTYRFKKKDTTYIWLETAAKHILNEHNEVVGIQTSSRDVSERIKAEEEIKTALLKERELNKMKSRFVAMASHQFRTPLTVIYSNAELMELKTNHFDKKTIHSIENITSRIKKEVDRMTELMNNILIFGKYESKKIKKEIKTINFNTYIKTLINTYFNNALHEGSIQLKIKGKKQVFHTDETLLTHILTNLISNAFKYSVGKSNPIVTLTYLEHEIIIEIIDFGIGIPENETQYLFTSFFRASNTNTIIGSGLGLAIVKQFTDFLNGKIEIQTKENIGTKIKLIFPYEQN
ncbi:sensor histidine kinase [Flavobacterium restrictum]|uniref:histidine kinase n=1 Tax=Flavobacterium restrictum TaxID=2594428 RepID=A0A553E8Y9_9FLAO|nr:PAS domain-containing protein [Flavobacterium restrictum]TRX41534.1 PAS domain S-box protein [Flavobacterium restrictum]